VEIAQMKLLGKENVEDFSMGGGHYLAMGGESVYGWGDNSSFELGFMNIENYERPKKVFRGAFVFKGSDGGKFDPEVENLENEKVIGVLCGNRVSYFQTESCLYSVGDEQFGKLGLG
jgi:alpha-tubulin suppressor-like RCC1 family protein